MKPYFLIQGGAFWIGAHYSTDTKRLCINFLPFLTLCLVFEGGQVPRQIRARQEKARQTTEDLAEHLTPAGKLIGVEIAPPCSCYNGTQDPFCWHHGVKISDTDSKA